jgi:hypothetical protein
VQVVHVSDAAARERYPEGVPPEAHGVDVAGGQVDAHGDRVQLAAVRDAEAAVGEHLQPQRHLNARLNDGVRAQLAMYTL